MDNPCKRLAEKQGDLSMRFEQATKARATSSKLLIGAVLAALMFTSMPTEVIAATPTVGGGANVAYTENADAVLAGAGLTVANGMSFDGKYIEFAIGSPEAADVLSLQKVQTAITTNDVVSVVGSQIFIGDGVNANPFASIDETRNGTNGQPLRINFSSAFGNSGFENATTGAITIDAGNTSVPSISTRLPGWTIVGIGNANHYIDLGVTSLGGYVSVDTNNTYPINAPNEDNNKPASATFSAEITTGTKSEGSKSLRLFSSMTTLRGCDVVHGPAAVSDPFSASAGDVISFDWSAQNGGDDYDAYGYIVNTASGAQTEVIDSNGTSQVWTRKDTTIPATGNYRFVFVNGTHDRSCGLAAGGSLYIDNIRVVGNKATDANVQKVARLLTYRSTSDNPATTKQVTFTAVPAVGDAATTTFNINITLVNDVPVLNDATVRMHDTAVVDAFPTQTGTLTATDLDDSSLKYFIKSGANRVGELAGTYGTLTLIEATGAYTYVPDATAINGLLAAKFDSFTIEVEDSGGGLGAGSKELDTATLKFDILYETVYVIAPANLAVDKGTTTSITGFSLGGTAPSNTTSYLLSIELTGAPAGTTGKIGSPQSVTAAEGYANSFNSFTLISFIGTPSQINTALASLQIISGNTAGNLSLKVTATKYLANSAYYNGNYYVSVTGNVSWTAASTAAKASTYLGLTGYLVTITSQAEQDFVASKIPNASNIWIGATDAAAEGTWLWESGTTSPDAGKRFWSGAANGARTTADGINYDNWCRNAEPNNAGSSENYAVTNWGGNPCWNDLPESFGSVQGYVIEYGNNQVVTNSLDTDSETISVTVNASSAPTNASAAASNITTTSATLNANVNASGAATTNRFCITTSATLNNCAVTDGATVTTLTPDVNATLSGRVTTAVSVNVSNLSLGTTYYFQSFSTNADGGPIYGVRRSFSTIAAEVPGKPIASPANGRATITITPPATMTPISYVVTSSPGGLTCQVTGATGSCIVEGLSNGVSYTFTSVANYNGNITSQSSVASDPVVPRAPALPAQIDRITTPPATINPYAGTSSVAGNFTRQIVFVTVNGNTIPLSQWKQEATKFELDTKSFPPGSYEVSINNGAATPLVYTFEKPALIEVAPVVKEPTQFTTQPIVLEGNKPVSVTKEVTNNQAGFSIKGNLWNLDLSAQNQDQTPAPVIRDNRMVLLRDLQVFSKGTGFMPFSTVKIFMFSEPIQIGTATVKGDGTFETLSNLPQGIELGDHLLQVNGISPANEVRSTTLKVLLTEAPNSLVLGFNKLQRNFAANDLEKIKAIFNKPIKKIVVDAYSKPTEPRSDRKFAARRASVTASALKAIDANVTIKVRNRGGMTQPLCDEFKNRCVVVTVRR